MSASCRSACLTSSTMLVTIQCWKNCFDIHKLKLSFWIVWVDLQMAYELHGLLAGNISIVTGENIKPSYGGDNESFLRKVITPIYQVIEKVLFLSEELHASQFMLQTWQNSAYFAPGIQEKWKWESPPHSLVQLWWSEWVFLVKKSNLKVMFIIDIMLGVSAIINRVL